MDDANTAYVAEANPATILKLLDAIEVMQKALGKIVEPPEYLENGGDAYALYANLLANKANVRVKELLGTSSP